MDPCWPLWNEYGETGDGHTRQVSRRGKTEGGPVRWATHMGPSNGPLSERGLPVRGSKRLVFCEPGLSYPFFPLPTIHTIHSSTCPPSAVSIHPPAHHTLGTCPHRRRTSPDASIATSSAIIGLSQGNAPTTRVSIATRGEWAEV